MRSFSVTRREERKRESALFVCADFLFRIFFHLLVVWRSLRQKRSGDTHARAQKKEREKREFLCGSKKRDFSDDDDEVVYIFLSGNMAQRSPRKSLQLNRANTPINFSGPMQDVNVSSASFFF